MPKNIHEEAEIEMTIEDFADWLKALPEDTRSKRIWFIDITFPWKGKPLIVEESPSKSHISIEDATGENPR
jgi:hypothetical protein